MVKTPLSLGCRLAFLSVDFAKHEGLNEVEAEMVATKRQRLDRETHRVDAKSLGQDVVALIFLFAAEPKARVVELKILRDEDDSDFSDDDYDYDDE